MVLYDVACVGFSFCTAITLCHLLGKSCSCSLCIMSYYVYLYVRLFPIVVSRAGLWF